MSTQPAPQGAITNESQSGAPLAVPTVALAPRPRQEVASFDANDPVALYMNTAIFDQLQRVGAMMARSAFVPEHLRANSAENMQQKTGDCFLVAAQAFRWGMDPFAVAQHTFVYKGKLGYEGKLIAAVVNTHPRMLDALDYEYSGSGDQRQVRVFARRKGDAEAKSVTGTVKQWATDNVKWREMPDQMLAYRGAREWARRWMPEAVLGVQGDGDDSEVVDITPRPPVLPEPEPEPVHGLAATKQRLAAKQPEPAKEAVPAPEPAQQVLPPEREPGADDAEPEKPCAHQPLWRLAASAQPGRSLVCPDCSKDVTPAQVKDAREAAKAGA